LIFFSTDRTQHKGCRIQKTGHKVFIEASRLHWSGIKNIKKFKN